MENILDKGEIAYLKQFRLFPQCFLKAFILQYDKMSTYGGRVKLQEYFSHSMLSENVYNSLPSLQGTWT